MYLEVQLPRPFIGFELYHVGVHTRAKNALFQQSYTEICLWQRVTLVAQLILIFLLEDQRDRIRSRVEQTSSQRGLHLLGPKTAKLFTQINVPETALLTNFPQISMIFCSS